jgi:Alginate export
MNRKVISACVCGLGLAAKSVLAQTPPISAQESANQSTYRAEVAEADFQRRLDQFQYDSRTHVNEDIPADERALVDYGGYITFNYLSVADPNDNTHILRETDAVGYARVNLDNVQEVFVRGRMSIRDYGEDDSFGGVEGSGQHSSVEQAYYRFDLQKYLSAYEGISTTNDVAVQLGRQTVIWGNGLTFNEDIDGGVLDFSKGPFTFEGVAGVTVPDTIDFDTSRPGFNDRTTRGFFGTLLGYQIGRNHPYAYFLSERDFNSDRDSVISTSVGDITTNFDYNADYVGLGSTGSLNDRLAYGVEGTLENGNNLSNSYVRTSSGIMPVPQRTEAITAFAADGRLDYIFPEPHNTRASLELTGASGDHDRDVSTNDTFGGVRPGTKDLAFNGFGLLNTGLAFGPDVSNVLITRAGVSSDLFNDVPLFRKLELGVDVFMYDKYLEQAPIDEPTDPGRYLGWEPDFFLNWQITSDVTFAARFGDFIPGDKILSSNRDRELFFTGVTIAF